MFWLHIHICVCLMFIELRRSTRRVQGPLGRDLQALVAICMGAGYWTWVLWMSRPCFNHWAISPTWHVILERLKCEATSGIFIYCLFLKDHWTLKCLMILAKRTLWSYALACLPVFLPSFLFLTALYVQDSPVWVRTHACRSQRTVWRPVLLFYLIRDRGSVCFNAVSGSHIYQGGLKLTM